MRETGVSRVAIGPQNAGLLLAYDPRGEIFSYRHDYDNVAEEFVWRAVQHSLQPLLDAVEQEIAGLPDTG